MKKGQTSIRAGIEDFLCPFTDMFVTQGAGGNFSHKGTMANDVNHFNGNTQRVPYYAPCKVKCIAVYPSSGQSMWQSVNDVRCSNKYVGKVTFMIAHDDSQDCHVGQIVNQGQQLGNMGTKGNATGVHCHIEISQSADTSWVQNEYGIYRFKKEVDTDDCYFCDGTNILNMQTAKWKYLKDVPIHSFKQSGSIQALFDDIRVRTEASTSRGDTGIVYNTGMVLNYIDVVEADDWYWAKYNRSKGGYGYCALQSVDGKNVYWKQV